MGRVAEAERPQGPRWEDALRALTAMPGVSGAVVATDDGLPLAMRLQAGQDREALAAAAAVLGRLATRSLAALDRGHLELGVFDTNGLRLILRPLSLGFLLALAEPEADIGLIATEMNSAAEALERAAMVAGRAGLTALGGA